MNDCCTCSCCRKLAEVCLPARWFRLKAIRHRKRAVLSPSTRSLSKKGPLMFQKRAFVLRGAVAGGGNLSLAVHLCVLWLPPQTAKQGI